MKGSGKMIAHFENKKTENIPVIFWFKGRDLQVK